MKFALVLMMETRVVEEARVRAAVKSVHIMALKARLRRKKNCRGRRDRLDEDDSVIELDWEGGMYGGVGGVRRE